MIEAVAKRGILAVGVATLGAAWCLVNDHYWYAKLDASSALLLPGAFASIGGDLWFVAVPFYALAVAIALVGRPRLVGTMVTFAVLGVLTSFEFWANGISTSSTAPLVFVASIIYGIPIVCVSVLVQVFIDALRRRSTRIFVEHLSPADQADWAQFISKSNETS